MIAVEYKAYLDKLRDSGVTNMFGAAEYLITDFPITREEAKAILIEWMALYK